MLDEMVSHFRDTRSPMELFEALKMRIRDKLGLPLVSNDNEPSRPEDVERQLEVGLLDACRETGTMLLEDGRIGEGWMYLRPTGDLQLAKDLISRIDVTEDNYDDMIQVLLHEGIDVARGYQTVLDQQGTCNSITLYEQALSNRSKTDQQAAAKCLLNHLYSELCELVRGDISRREAPAGDDESLAEMIGSNLKFMFQSNWLSKLGYLLLKPKLVEFKKKVDHSETGGAPLLGVNGVVIIAHGSSSPKAIKNAINRAQELSEKNIIEHIKQDIELNLSEIDNAKGTIWGQIKDIAFGGKEDPQNREDIHSSTDLKPKETK